MMERVDRKESAEVFGTEEALAKISIELMRPDDDKLLTLSDVTPEEVFIFPTMLSIADKFNSELLKAWVRKFLLLRISKLRAGRGEFSLILGGIRDIEMLKKKGGKLSDLYAGFR